jgi:hypothetical protein
VGLVPGAWSSFDLDPRVPAHRGLRAGDRDRATAAHLLGGAYADGRLDPSEHDGRAPAATRARLRGDLVPLLEDLVPPLSPEPSSSSGLARATPAELRERAAATYAKDLRSSVMGFLVPSIICWTIWALTTPGEFAWPLIVSAVTALNVLRMLVQRQDLVSDHVRSLERKQVKAIAREERAAAREELPSQKLKEAARAIEQDVVRRVSERFRPPSS